MGSIPGGDIKVPQASECSQKFKKQSIVFKILQTGKKKKKGQGMGKMVEETRTGEW